MDILRFFWICWIFYLFIILVFFPRFLRFFSFFWKLLNFCYKYIFDIFWIFWIYFYCLDYFENRNISYTLWSENNCRTLLSLKFVWVTSFCQTAAVVLSWALFWEKDVRILHPFVWTLRVGICDYCPKDRM